MPFLPRSSELSPPVGAGDAGIALAGPPGCLLRPGGPDLPEATTLVAIDPAPAPKLAPDEALDLDAARLVRLLDLRTGLPSRWTAPAFCREVDLVRSHLRLIRSRPLLASSFGREAFHGQASPGSDRALGGSAVRVAYALRWLELGDLLPRAAWRALVQR